MSASEDRPCEHAEGLEVASDLEIEEELDDQEAEAEAEAAGLRRRVVEDDRIPEHEQHTLEQEYDRIDLTRLERAITLVLGIERPAVLAEEWRGEVVDEATAPVRALALRAAWDYIARSFTKARV